MQPAHSHRVTICGLIVFLGLLAGATSCTAFPSAPFVLFAGRPAANYDFGSSQPLRVAVLDETGANVWTPAIRAAAQTYGSATGHLFFQDSAAGANIVVRVREYSDSQPPEVPGYVFRPGVGGFAAVYDADGYACNFPALTIDCSGEIAQAVLYLNDVIPGGPDIENRRNRLVLHELGHAMGLERHAPDLSIAELAQRYGWQ